MSSVLGWVEQMWGLCGTISPCLPEKQLLVSSPRCNKRNHLSGDQLSVTPLAIANITFKATFQKSFSRDCTLCWIPPFPSLWLPYWPWQAITHVPLFHWRLEAMEARHKRKPLQLNLICPPWVNIKDRQQPCRNERVINLLPYCCSEWWQQDSYLSFLFAVTPLLLLAPTGALTVIVCY